ncbi:MAG: HAD-IIIA family hydrolase [Alphaproteobacteria bacterium]|nr:HAD-IIIA family hydrolase [Alphaproteobacteria bacterium]
MGGRSLNRAVFLDRDGVLNANVLNPATGCWESPHHPDDFRLHAGVLEALCRLQGAGYVLVVVSNQPSYAKGKTSLENIRAVAAKLEQAMTQEGIVIARYCYCLHHPRGIVPEYAIQCSCRKPSPYFLLEAARDFDLDPAESWMVGDRASDVACGLAAGVKTILVRPDHPDADVGAISPDFVADNLADAAEIILSRT